MECFRQRRKPRARPMRDMFSRPDGSYGFEEFRRDIEDSGQWTPVQYYSGIAYGSPIDALDAAERCVPWLADILVQKPELRIRIGWR